VVRCGWPGAVAGATIGGMPKREQLHKEVDAVPDDQLERVHLVLEPAVEVLASRNENGTGEDRTDAARRARDFLISVADGTSGLDLDSLRTVRERAWR